MLSIRSMALTAPLLAASLMALTPAQAAGGLTRLATFEVHRNLAADESRETTTAAEIITASQDGQTLVYTDSPAERLGFIDITEPSAPEPDGFLALDGEPTSVTVVGGTALVGVNTSADYRHPDGHLAVVDMATRQVLARCPLGGQPDSVAASPDGDYLAVAIENERDEDHNDGALPQLPVGFLSVLRLNTQGRPSDCETPTRIDLTGQAAVAGEDPEPEFVDINDKDQVVLTLQENNHLIVADLTSGELILSTHAGTVDLDGIPTEEGRLNADGELKDVPREPDAVGWLDDSRFVTANEGDYQGGSRGFTIFNRDGEIEYDSGNALERLALTYGSYPAKRAHKKGAEPEGIEVWGERGLFFVGLERAAAVAVYRDRGPGQAPEFVQWLPTGVGPEGLLAIPQRDLFVIAAEEDDPEAGLRSTVSLYRWSDSVGEPALIGEDADGQPIGFGALSGLAADPGAVDRFWAVSDNFYPEARLYRLDARRQPARIIAVTILKTADGGPIDLDLEGVAPRRAGGVWVASEGKPDAGRANEILGVAADGTIVERFTLPASVAERMGNYGFEGVARLSQDGKERLAVIFQRPLEGEADQARLGLLNPETGEWRFVAVAMQAPTSPAGGWVGFSEIIPLADGRLALIERDNQSGERASLKRVVTISLDGVEPVAADQAPPRLTTQPLMDLLPVLAGDHGMVVDKPEGMGQLADGRLLVVTDNDGVDDSISQTYLLRLTSPDA